MKRVFFFSAILLITACPVLAASENSEKNQEQNQIQTQEQNTNDSQNQEQVQTEEQNQINNDESVGVEVQERARDREQLKTMIEEKKKELKQTADEVKETVKQKIYQNQNIVREAVHALQAAEDLVGGIGPQVSAIAIEFNNSVQATIRAEETIKIRNGFTRFFMGGDDQTAEEILQQVQQNRDRLRELNQLHQELCNCDPELKEIVQEQISNMEQEQNRLGDLANQEKEKKGLFGWMFGWLVN